MATQSVKLAHSGASTITSASWSPSITTLASNTQSTSPVQDNSTNLYVYSKVSVQITTAASAVSATGFLEIWLLDSADAGTTYPSPYTNGVLLGSLAAVAVSTTYSATFQLPEGLTNFEFVLNNQTGAALTAATVKLDYVYYTVG